MVTLLGAGAGALQTQVFGSIPVEERSSSALRSLVRTATGPIPFPDLPKLARSATSWWLTGCTQSEGTPMP